MNKLLLILIIAMILLIILFVLSAIWLLIEQKRIEELFKEEIEEENKNE